VFAALKISNTLFAQLATSAWMFAVVKYFKTLIATAILFYLFLLGVKSKEQASSPPPHPTKNRWNFSLPVSPPMEEFRLPVSLPIGECKEWGRG